MGQISDRADRYMRKVFTRPVAPSVTSADQKAQTQRLEKLAQIRARIINRRKGAF